MVYYTMVYYTYDIYSFAVPRRPNARAAPCRANCWCFGGQVCELTKDRGFMGLSWDIPQPYLYIMSVYMCI